MTDPTVEKWLQYTHLDKLYGYLPGGVPADPDLQGDDGVHPTLQGRSAITRRLVATLGAGATPAERTRSS